MRIAIVGGTRFVGRAIAERAIDRGHDVVVLHRGVHANETRAQSMIVDRGDAAALGRALREARPDRVIDTRAMTERDALVLAEAAEGARVVVLSSQDVYAQFGRLNGLPAPEPEPRVSEGSPLTIPFPFRGIGSHEAGEDYDKKDVERVVTSSGAFASVVVLRLPAIYGEHDHKRRFSVFVDAIDRGERTIAHRDATWRWTHADVRDVAHATLLAAEGIERGVHVFNVGEGEVPTMRERVDGIARAMGASLEWVPGEDVTGVLGGMPNDFVADDAKLRSELGFAELDPAEVRTARLVNSLRSSRAFEQNDQ